jgi:hypothetical protein
VAERTHYVAVIASAAGASKRHLAIFNGASSTETLKILEIRASGAPTVAVTGLVVPLVVYRITAAPTGGSTVTPGEAVTADANLDANVVLMAAATGGATEAAAVAAGVVSGEETASANSDLLYQAPIDGRKPLTLVAGEGILVKQGALASAGAISVVVTMTAA